MEINILITSTSRKVWLVKAFKAALRREEIDGKIVSVDVNPLSAAFYASDKHYLVPPSSEESFIPSVLDICIKENIKLLIPTRGGELLLFAKKRNIFERQGTRVMVSNSKVIETCNDKHRFYRFLRENNITTPKTCLLGQVDLSFSNSYPVILKSRCGAGSKSVFKVRNKNDLSCFAKYVVEPLIQELVVGKEYTIDLFSDFHGNVITVVPRERIEVVSGESYKGKTVEDDKMIEQAKYLAEKLGTIGHITIQCIKNNGGIKFIEVNPRFGGGAMLGIMAGANTPLLLVRLILGKKLKPHIGQYKKDLYMLRYTTDIFLEDGQVAEEDDPCSDF